MSTSRKPKVLGVIPARIGSTRVPEKMILDICGKPLIQRTIERTQRAKNLDALVVATDSERIAEIATNLGVRAIMTPSELPTGTDRTAAAVKQFSDFVPDIVVNVWGDEPLYSATAIDACVELLLEDPDLQVAGVGDLIEDEKMIAEPSLVKVLTDLKNNVLCFSRAFVPHPYNSHAAVDVYHITGAMALRRDFLYMFLTLPQGPLELREGVEQMRILEHGYRMRIVKGTYQNLGVNTPEELEQVRVIVAERIEKGELT
jgi:3-deoxy-manno-octulosonate cytidylyltransferase (CMP-KDO synthetase)